MSGAVTLPAEIDGQTYRLIFKFGTIRLAEKELPEKLAGAFAGAEGGVSLDMLSAVFWAVLQPHHNMTRDASDDLIDKAGVAKVTEWIGEGLSRYFGAGDEVVVPEGNEPAPKGKAKKAAKPPAS